MASEPKLDIIVKIVQMEILPQFRSPVPDDPKKPRPKMILTSAVLSDRDDPEPHDMFLEYEIMDVKGRERANGLEVITEVRVGRVIANKCCAHVLTPLHSLSATQFRSR